MFHRLSSLLFAFTLLSANSAIRAADKGPPPNEIGGILFAGASGISHWKSRQEDFKEYKLIARTCNGTLMIDMVSNIDKFFPYKPSIIFMQLGGNDIASGKTPDQVFADFKDFVEKTRAVLPEVVIIYMGLVPTPRRWNQREPQEELNKLIKEYSTTRKKMDYLDEWEPFLRSDGTPRTELFLRDGQHNNEEGNKIRAQLARPYLVKWNAPTK